jgi:hypothetical protein
MHPSFFHDAGNRIIYLSIARVTPDCPVRAAYICIKQETTWQGWQPRSVDVFVSEWPGAYGTVAFGGTTSTISRECSIAVLASLDA